MSTREDTITIDGTNYPIPIKKLTIKADALDKYAERTVDGELHREMIGVYYNYELEFASGYRYPLDYVRLWAKITEAEEFHTITLWDENGPLTFEGYFANPQNEMLRIKNGVTYWKSMSVSVVSKSPTKVPA